MSATAAPQAPPLNELELARAVAAGMLPSGQPCGGARLWAVRISGTGLAARPAHHEIAIRDPAIWLSDEMVQRCAGLPVVIEHPEGGQLDSDEFANRTVGMITWPYVANGELWGVARIFDDAANQALAAGACSTSPSATFAPGDGGQAVELGNGQRLNVEGDPYRLDHLALVPDAGGVWDRGISGRGVRCDSNNNGDTKMSDVMDAAPDPVAAALEKLVSCMSDMTGRLDALGARMDGLEAAAAKPAQGDLPNSAKQVAADGMLTTGTEREEFRREEDLRRGAAMAKLGEESLKREQEFNKQLAEAQSRADKALIEFGQRAEMPMRGETVSAYRRRMLRPLKQYCSDYKDVNIDGIDDPKMLDIIEGRIYGDAVEAARNCEHLPDNGPHPVTKDWDGHKVTTWHGKRTFIAALKPPLRRAKLRAVPHFNNQPD